MTARPAASAADRWQRGGQFATRFGPSIDHITPVSRGGSNHPTNLQLAHLICNTSKNSNESYRPAVRREADGTVDDPQGSLF